MLEELRVYCENNLTGAIKIANGDFKWCKSKEDKIKAITSTLDRCAGASDMMNILGVPFDEVDAIYEEYRVQFYDLYKKVRDL